MKKNIIKDKSLDFALSIICLYKYLVYNKKEFVMSKQILKSGTSIGANVEESIEGQSIRDFYAKLFIAYKEARETRYWLKLLSKSDYIGSVRYIKLKTDIDEICRILGKILSTSKNVNVIMIFNYKL
ncbi:four helix bundle protein [Patescibacteria group bacterium]